MGLKVPLLREALAKAEAKLGGVLGGECSITVHHEFPQGLARVVEEIENRKFRQELQYTLRELVERSKRRGFTCILFTLDGEPFAFDLGYSDADEGAYFGDSAATPSVHSSRARWARCAHGGTAVAAWPPLTPRWSSLLLPS